MLRQILLPLPRNPCASQRARLRRQRDLNDHIHRIQFSLSSRGKMPAGVHDALLTLNADGCEIECQPAELKGLPRGSEKSWIEEERERRGWQHSILRTFQRFAFPQIASHLESRRREQSLREQTTPAPPSLRAIFPRRNFKPSSIPVRMIVTHGMRNCLLRRIQDRFRLDPS